ncbi:MAG: TonB-dependent receptor [Bacteroides sp.]
MRKISLKGAFCPKSLGLKQFLLTMKITLFLLLFITFQAYSENTYSQSNKVNITHSKQNVGELLSQIESQTDYLFVYNKKNVDINRQISLNIGSKPVSEILEIAFEGTGIRYIMEGKNIILTKTQEQPSATAQQKKITIKGVVVDSKGEPIIGANVVEKGTSNGIITNLNGEFSLQMPSNGILSVSYIGYQSQDITINGRTSITIKMQEESTALEQVIVTALGIKKKAASLTYSAQDINGNELTRAKDPNMINALAGKSAGVQINKSSSGLGGSAKVSIRGSRSAFESGNNQPLYVIDGVPMLNTSTASVATVMGGENDGVNRDAGDGISNLNPDDIESMSILKGASAAALYGSQAANGVILITTKQGKSGMQKVTFSSNLTIDKAISLPKFQNSFGASGEDSWGEQKELKDYDNVDHFFNSGAIAMNTLSLMSGNEKMQTYFSYANTTAKGIIDSNKLSKHNFTLRETGNFFNNKLKIDANANLMMQNIKNSTASGGLYLNPLVDVYGFPRGLDLSEYETTFEKPDPTRNGLPVQHWYTGVSEWTQNPYWIKNRVTNNNKRYRALAYISANLKINDWLTIQTRANVDYISDKFEQKMYASTARNITGSYEDKENGRYVWSESEQFQLYGDVMAMFNKTFNRFSINGAIGTSTNIQKVNSLSMDSKIASLYKPNVFTVANIVMNTNATIDQSINQKRTIQSIFGTVQVGFDDAFYLDITSRNDWSSTLAYTKSKNSGYFYPSVGLSWIMSNTIKMPEWISFGKIRGSWAQVGSDLPIGISNPPADRITAGGGFQANDTYNKGNLKPEISTSYEFGTEWSFFQKRLGIDFTYYETNTRNQLLRIPTQPGNKYAYEHINAGKVRNRGIEISLNATPIMNDSFRWKTILNYSKNENKIVELYPTYKSFPYGDPNISMAYMMRIVEGGSMGDIYGNAFVRENGKIKTNSDGSPVVEAKNLSLLGNCNPDFLLGWSNTLTYKDFSLYFLIDTRAGGDVMSLTQGMLDKKGVTKATADARKAGFVEYEGTKFTDVQKFYSLVGDRNGISEYYMYDATNIRLREVSLSYSFPRSILDKTKFIKGIDLSLIGRNLFFFYKSAPFDPDAILSTGNTLQGVDVFGMPTTRNIGFNIKLTF